MAELPPHLRRLEAEAIHIMREVVAEFRNPVMLYSIGKDSSAMLHVAIKAFHPAPLPFPLLHVDTTWKFREMIAFRDETARRLGLDLRVHINQDGARARHFADRLGQPGPHPGDEDRRRCARRSTTASSTRPSAARGATRKRAAPRSASSRTARPPTPGTRATSGPSCGGSTTPASASGESMRVFPLSNWTELDVWEYVRAEDIPVVPLYFAKERPVVERGGTLIMVDDDRLPLRPGEKPQMKRVRFRTLGCYPLTGAIESDADTLDEIIAEMRAATTSERQGRLIDSDESASMEKKKREGYF